MGDELKAQVRRGVASAARAYRVPLDNLDLLVEAFEHAQAQSYEGIGFDRLALAIEQERVTFDLREFEIALVSGQDGFEQFVNDVRAVYQLSLGQKLRVAADVRDQDRRAFSHCYL